MKSLNPGRLSFGFSLIITSVVTLLAIIFINFLSEAYWLYIVLFIVNFALVYSISLYFMHNFIEQRLKPIFKIIRDVPVEEVKKAKERNTKSSYLFDVNTEVTKWATHKQEEIKRLKELEKYRKEFVGNVSHELKTPIFNIQGYIMTLIEGGIDDKRINKLYLKRTVKSIDRMISIVEDLESINKLESGELTLHKEKFNIIKLVEEIFEIEHMLAKERKITLAFSTKIDKPVYVFADKKRIFAVISNLVVNAIKYGKRAGYANVGFFDFDDHIVVEVKDNGIGIDRDHVNRIFERFYRVDKHRSREQGGTGLGLSIVKHIIEAHEQTINVKSQTDVGTTFNFTLAKAGN